MKQRFLSLWLCVLIVPCGLARAQCTLPSAPGLGTPDSSFDQFFQQNGPGWTGADGTFSIPLPDGTNLWMWADSFIGSVNPLTRLRASYLITAHNSLTIQNQEAGTLTTVGYPPNTSSYFVPANKSDWFWPGDATVVETSPGTYQIKMILQEWTGVFHFVGDSVATLSWPELSIESVEPIALPDTTIEWGAKILQIDGVYYLYGILDPGTAHKLPYLARFQSIDDLTQPSQWEYWNASENQWVAGQENATALSGIPDITDDYTVSELSSSDTGTFFLMVGMDTESPSYPGWKYITTYYSCTPQGPWSNRTVVYVTPESGARGCKLGQLYTYDPRAHPEFTEGEEILISYNVNALESKDLVCANDYVPRFIQVPIAGLLPGGQ